MRQSALLLGIAVVCAACAPTLEQAVWQLRRDSWSMDAYHRAERRLSSIPPGAPLTPEIVGWRAIELRDARERSVVVPLADGWIRSVSGPIGLGRVFARSGDRVWAWHVFGYMFDPDPDVEILSAPLFPRYLMVTRAQIVDRPQNERRDARRSDEPVGPGGSFYLPGDPTERYFIDLRVESIRPLPGGIEPGGEAVEIERLSYEDFAKRLVSPYTRESYELARERIEALALGTDLWDVYAALGARWVTGAGPYWNAGEGYVVYMDGYANWEVDRKWFVNTERAIYEIWPFGHVIDEEQIEMLYVIFENGRLYEVAPWQPRSELTTRLTRGSGAPSP